MKKALPAPIESLFARYPSLSGFSVRGLADVPDNCARSGDAAELFVSDVGVSLSLTREHYGEMFQEITAALAELLAEKPNACEELRGRTFARILH